MDKNESVTIIAEEIYDKLLFYKQKNIKIKIKLDKLIDEIKEKKQLTENIRINKIIKKINNINVYSENHMNIYKNNNTYFIELLEKNNDDNLSKEIKSIFYSLFIIFNMFILLQRFEFLAPIIISVAFVITFILKVVYKTNKFSIIINTILCLMCVKAQNPYILITVVLLIILSFFLITSPDEHNKEYDKEDKGGLISLFLILCCLAFACFYISFIFTDAKDYIIIKSITIVALFIYYIFINSFNILQTSLFLIISFSIYNLLSNIMETLNDKSIIFHPYVEVFNFDYSLVSIAFTIVILSVPLVTRFIKNIFNFGNLYNILIAVVTYIPIILILFFLSYIGDKTSIICSVLIGIITLYLYLTMILDNPLHDSKFNSFFTHFNILLFLGNNNKNYKIIDYINNFYKPLEIDKKIKFSPKIYIENISFVVLSFVIITSFISNYNHVYHYKEFKQNEICDIANKTNNKDSEKEETYKIYQKDSSKYIYRLIEKSKDPKEFKDTNSIFFEFNNFSGNYYVIKESCSNYNNIKINQ